MKKVYICQFDSWWVTSLSKYIEWLERYISSPDVWNLNDLGKELKRVPYHALYSTRIDHRASFMPRNNSDLVISMPCDWEIRDYQSALDDANELLRELKG